MVPRRMNFFPGLLRLAFGRVSLATLACCCAAVAYGQQAGRVLMIDGELTVRRGSEVTRLAVNDRVLSGDTLVTGRGATAQVLLADDSLIALRANSEFRIDDYRFTPGSESTSAAAFSLLKGGLRKITGLIAATSRDRFITKTRSATVGIRGTAYTLVYCEDDCDDGAGTKLPDGLYGAVYEGAVVLTNQAGERQFGIDQAFYVPGPSATPRELASRPLMLKSQAAQERSAAPPPSERDTDANNVRQLGQGISVAELRNGSGDVAVFGAALGAGVAWVNDRDVISTAAAGGGNAIVLDGQRGFLEAFQFTSLGLRGGRGSANIADVGALIADGNNAIGWGRWAPGAAVDNNGVISQPGTGVHFFYGTLTPASFFGAQGANFTATYDLAGGTRPTNINGDTGQLVSGTFNVSIQQRSIGGDIAYRIGNLGYSLVVPSGTPLITGGGGVGFIYTGHSAGAWQNLGTGTNGRIDSYVISGLLMGARAQGLGVTFATDDRFSGRTAGAAVFKCTKGCS